MSGRPEALSFRLCRARIYSTTSGRGYSPGGKVGGGREPGLGFEVGDALAEGGKGALQRLGARYQAQWYGLVVDAGDDACGHACWVAGGGRVGGVEHGEEAVRRRV